MPIPRIVSRGAEALGQEIAMRKVLSIVALTGALLVSACNTVEGVGKDVRSAGDTVADTARDAK